MSSKSTHFSNEDNGLATPTDSPLIVKFKSKYIWLNNHNRNAVQICREII